MIEASKRDGLLGELLALDDSLGGVSARRVALVILALLAVELGPLGLVAGLEEGLMAVEEAI